LICAWANGAKIQYKHVATDLWLDTEEPGWYADIEYRIKPVKRPDRIRYAQCTFEYARAYRTDGDNLRLIFDAQTGVLKEAIVLGDEE
jgi:hypothetical protein